MPVPVLSAAVVPPTDRRAAVPPVDLDTTRTFPTFRTLAEWKARRDFIRTQILVSCGLYPLPPKTPLQPHVFDKVERDGYTIEKVAIQTYPGFYLAGNLYRPFGANSGGGKHPGVLVAHGHWAVGRMADTPDGSIAARAITFARQGYVAFTYDMVGYNDTRQIDHKFAGDRRHWLWGVSLMGLQTWDSLRALDFLASLPDVDTKRLAITGESGGGTQTMMLGAIDDRLAAVGPCVMVSHTMQGGCLCENAPGLRVEFSNMEVAACAAPKYQIMVGASGDWTKTTMMVEGPAVASVYALYGKPQNLQYVLYDYGHNINKTSREAVYTFFGAKLLGETDPNRLKEPPYTMEPVESLRVFPDNTPLPPDAKTADQLTDYLIQEGKAELERRKPHDAESLREFKKTFRPMWEHTLAVTIPKPDALWSEEQKPTTCEGGTLIRLAFGRTERGDNIPAALFLPNGKGKHRAVILAHPNGRAAFMDIASGTPGPLVRALLQKGVAVLLLDAFLTGERADAAVEAARRPPFGKYFSTYNRTDLQERVQDLLTACAYLRSRRDVRSVTLAGLEKAGLWALLAAPAADAVAADGAQTDLTTDDALLADDLFAPCLRRMGDFHTAAVMAAPHPLLLLNTGAKFVSADWIADVYRSLGAAAALHIETGPIGEEALIQRLAEE
jgi:dienelactone hydrolase